jgi:hypothetical protein
LSYTEDGGERWVKINTGDKAIFNRFFAVSDTSIFLSGRKIYKLDPEGIPEAAITEPTTILAAENPYEHGLHASPNPVYDKFKLEVRLKTQSRCRIEISNAQGKTILHLLEKILPAGIHDFEVSTEDWPDGLYIVSLQTNEGYYYRKLMVRPRLK